MENIIPKILVTTGAILILAGLLIQAIPKLKLHLLPGDILIQKDNFTFYFPITTSILLSIILSLLAKVFLR